jgi:aspartate beta-hydroxylase
MDVADVAKREIFQTWIPPLVSRYGAEEMKRVAHCAAMFLGLAEHELADPRQHPSFLYFPGLPVEPVFERPAFAEALEAQTDAIRAEMEAVRDGEGTKPFHDHVPEAARDSLTRGGAWDAYFFWRDGKRFDDHHAACPVTSAALAALPLDVVCPTAVPRCASRSCGRVRTSCGIAG